MFVRITHLGNDGKDGSKFYATLAVVIISGHENEMSDGQ